MRTAEAVAGIGLIAAVISANIFWYRLKFVLRSNGYKASFLWGHFRDWVYYHDLYSSTPDRQLRHELRIIAWGTWGSVLLAIIAVVFLGAA